MYILDPHKMQPVDIILCRFNNEESNRIRRLSNSDYSHAILYVGEKSCIESDGLGVQSQNIQRMAFDEQEDVCVFRAITKLGQDSLNEIIYFARRKIGTEYSTSEARASVTHKGNLAANPNRQFCTRFVAQAYNEANQKIVDNPDFCSPADIQSSALLKKVDSCLKLASKEELAYALEEDTPLTKQRDIHNDLFERVRQFSGQDIQTFEQLGDYVIANPSSDLEIVNIVKKSGYLDMWKMDLENNPWFYDFDEFLVQFPNPEQRFEIGSEQSLEEPKIRERFIITLATNKRAFKITNLKIFKTFIDLNEKLIELSLMRDKVWNMAKNEKNTHNKH